MSIYLRFLLLPFSWLYGLVILVRNVSFDLGILKSSTFKLPVICVGNLAVGGSGKTPVTEYLVSLLEGRRIAILSRGYGRATKGFILADDAATAKTIGDEPLQYHRKFPGVTVAVCEDRRAGINRLKDNHDVIILDDAFQHRKVKAGLNILLFEYNKLFKLQILLPAGNLREPFSGFKRADIILVTKSPTQEKDQQQAMVKTKFNTGPALPLFFSFIEYGSLKPVFSSNSVVPSLPNVAQIHLLTGIANPQPLVDYLKHHSARVCHHEFPDHHQFSKRNILKVAEEFMADPSNNKVIITTEKDAQRLLDAPIKELLLNLPIFYLPIQVVINHADRQAFDQNILNYVSSTTRNR